MRKWNELKINEKLHIIENLDTFQNIINNAIEQFTKTAEIIVPPMAAMGKIVLTEKLAELEHDQWSHWMNYFFTTWLSAKPNISNENGDVYYNIKIASSEIVKWERRMNMSYNDLLDFEKESHRKGARKALELMEKFELV